MVIILTELQQHLNIATRLITYKNRTHKVINKMGRRRKPLRADIHMALSFEGQKRILQEAKARGGLAFGEAVDAIIRDRDNILQISIEQRNLIERFLMPELRESRVFVNIASMTIEEQLANICPFHCGFKGKNADDLWVHVYENHPFQIAGRTVPRGPINVSSAYVKKTMNILEGKRIKFQEETGPFQCPYCNAEPFDTKELLQKHIKAKHPKTGEVVLFAKPLYPCPYCDAGPFSKTELKSHVKEQHPAKYDALYKSGKRVA